MEFVKFLLNDVELVAPGAALTGTVGKDDFKKLSH